MFLNIIVICTYCVCVSLLSLFPPPVQFACVVYLQRRINEDAGRAESAVKGEREAFGRVFEATELNGRTDRQTDIQRAVTVHFRY